ncbi:MAG: S8 family serine peptidase [Chloroherpetonaceae bacterium]|nr:S8 family serine peptidase [Chloroherpetonaceae bacterium]
MNSNKLIFSFLILCTVFSSTVIAQLPSPLLAKRGVREEGARKKFHKENRLSRSGSKIIVKLRNSVNRLTLSEFQNQVTKYAKGKFGYQSKSKSPEATFLQVEKTRLEIESVQSISSHSSKRELQSYNSQRGKGIERIFSIRLKDKTQSALDAAIVSLKQLEGVEYVYQTLQISLDNTPADEREQTLESKNQNPLSESIAENDSLFPRQWNLRKIGIEKAWQITRGSPNVRIGIIDTGIDYTHPDLLDNIWINTPEDINRNGRFEPWSFKERRNPLTFELDANGITGDFDEIDQDGNGYPDDVIGWDFVDQPFNVDNLVGFSDFQTADPDPFDDNSHGTACAGIAAAVSSNQIGVSGVAPNCKLVALRVFSASGGFAGDLADDYDIASAIIYAADNGIQVLNMSFGDVVYSPIMRDAIEYAYERGVVMCFSSGNAGGDQSRYPAGYMEGMAVGATDENDFLTQFTTFGIRLAVCAPGSGIPTTVPFYDGYYTDFFSGTSAAAPHVAGVAALILSINPRFSPEQVRGAIVGTARDLESIGWDHFTASGRLDAALAVQMRATPIAKINFPLYDSGLSQTEGNISIVGTANSPNFESYQVFFQPGISGANDWTTITNEVNQIRIVDTLATWNIISLPDSDYTIRLLVKERNGRRIENRIRVTIDSRRPLISNLTVEPVYRNDEEVLLVAFKTKGLSSAFFRIESNGLNEEERLFRFPTEAQNHFDFISTSTLSPGIFYRGRVEAINRTGVKEIGEWVNFSITSEKLQQPTFGQFLFREKPQLRLPAGWILNKAVDYNRNGRREVVISEARPEIGASFGQLKRFEFTGQGFQAIDSAAVFLPMDIRDSASYYQLLAMGGGRSIVYSQNTPTSSPFQAIRFADTLTFNFWGARFGDVKGNGESHLIARNDTTYFILNSRYEKIATLKNPVDISKDGARPLFQEPRVAIEDFDLDSKPELLMSDADGNFFIYEYSGIGEAFDTTFLYRSGRFSTATLISTGDVDGDGKKEFLIGYRNQIGQTELRDFEAPIYFLELWRAVSNNKYERIWKRGFYGQFRNAALSLVDVDKNGTSEAVVLFYPNIYVLKWEEAQSKFKPYWHLPNVTAQNIAVFDADANGLNEIYFSDNLRTYAVEYQNYQGPLAPTGLNAEPLSLSKIKLNWKGQNATQYKVYRSEFTDFPTYPFSLQPLVTTSDTTWLDSTVERNPRKYFVYAVTSLSATDESDTTSFLFVQPALPLRLLSVVKESSNTFSLEFSDPVNVEEINPMNIVVVRLQSNDSLIPTSVISSKGGKILVLGFAGNQIQNGEYDIRVNGLKSVSGARIDSLNSSRRVLIANEVQGRLYITEKKVISPNQVDLTFNVPIRETEALIKTNYTFTSNVELSEIRIIEGNRKVSISTSGRPLTGSGESITLTIRNLISLSGQAIDTAFGGNQVSFNSAAPSLEQVYTYPNPYKSSSGKGYIMFANLTQSGNLYIYNTLGKVIKTLSFNNEFGGVKWFLDSNSGESVSSGVYLYRITSPSLPEKQGKLIIIR